jgi:putative transposase
LPVLPGPRAPQLARFARPQRGRRSQPGASRAAAQPEEKALVNKSPERATEFFAHLPHSPLDMRENAMPSTHTSLYYHIVFSTKYRVANIAESWQERLHSYLGGIVRGMGGTAVEIGGTSDHVHLAVRLKAIHRLADVIRDLKTNSSKWAHDIIGASHFGWQDGYGAFSVGKSQLAGLIHYIRGQRNHHQRKTFKEEYLDLLNENGVEFDERFIWE